jgi:hypothetical protein
MMRVLLVKSLYDYILNTICPTESSKFPIPESGLSLLAGACLSFMMGVPVLFQC